MKALTIGVVMFVLLTRLVLVSANDSMQGGFTIKGDPPVVNEAVIEVTVVDGTTTIHPLTVLAVGLTVASASLLVVVTTWPSRYPKKRSYDHS